ncbi:uncharacterized protein LOC133915337 [Phragmites australis]|uniref:uncharacterized protein LOC133915337 n=1 Tax=Phragmites australis TaxID=29695 RepID=UPI002D798E38|nr:uncharacterized protein LOC133915337 [Phragmites australis]
MAGVVGGWLGEFAKFGRPEVAQAAGAEAGQRHQGDDGIGAVESREKSGAQEKRRNSGVLSDSEAVVCMLMDRFAPA